MDVTIDISKTILETDRLILRVWKESDLNDMFEYASVDGVGEMAGWRHHESIEVTEKILQDFIKKSVFAIVHKDNNKVIGSLGLDKSGSNNDDEYKYLKLKEIGYVLSKDYWGLGLMPEAVKVVIDFCFNECDLDALTIHHYVSNSQSKRVIEKCGFTFVKNQEQYCEQLDEAFDSSKYILFR